MLTRSIDAALGALFDCRQRLPFLRDLQPAGSPRRAALDDVLAAVERAETLMAAPDSTSARRWDSPAD